MSLKNGAPRPIYSLLPTEVEGVNSLAELALDLRWSWNHATDGVWRALDPRLWALTQNPWVVLQTVSKDHLQRVLADPAFRKVVDGLLLAKRQAAEAPAWFQLTHPLSPPNLHLLFLHGIYAERSASHLLGGVGQRGR